MSVGQILFFFSFIMILLISPSKAWCTGHDINQWHSPWIEGDTIHIYGRIDSHIYDFLAYARQNILQENIRWVSLNSFGGNHAHALEVARLIRELNLNTQLESGHVCASACIYLFGAGQERHMSTDNWLGFHGARLGGHYQGLFQAICFSNNEAEVVYLPDTDVCQTQMQQWYDLALQATLFGLSRLREWGVSDQMEAIYFSKDDDPHWFLANNILKKPDWYIGFQQAIELNLATHGITP
jgi:hypothetical protein